MLQQLAEPNDHQVESVGQVAEHVCRYLTTFGQVAFTDVRDQDQEAHQPLLHIIALRLRRHKGRHAVQHDIERCGDLSEFVLRRDLRTGVVVAACRQLHGVCDMSNTQRQLVPHPVSECQTQGHAEDTASDQHERSGGSQGLSIFIQVLGNLFHVHDLLILASDHRLEGRLQVYREGQFS